MTKNPVNRNIKTIRKKWKIQTISRVDNILFKNIIGKQKLLFKNRMRISPFWKSLTLLGRVGSGFVAAGAEAALVTQISGNGFRRRKKINIPLLLKFLNITLTMRVDEIWSSRAGETLDLIILFILSAVTLRSGPSGFRNFEILFFIGTQVTQKRRVFLWISTEGLRTCKLACKWGPEPPNNWRSRQRSMQ